MQQRFEAYREMGLRGKWEDAAEMEEEGMTGGCEAKI